MDVIYMAVAGCFYAIMFAVDMLDSNDVDEKQGLITVHCDIDID